MTIHAFPTNRAPTHGPQQNPLLDGIPLLTTKRALFKNLARDPFREERWRQLNGDVDLFRLNLQQVLVPTNAALKVGTTIHKALKIALHQLDPSLAESKGRYYSAINAQDTSFLRGLHEGVCIQGITGVGKTHLIKATLASLPQCIERTNIAGLERITQIVWLYVDMSNIASIDAFAERIVEEIDSALGKRGELFEATFTGARSATSKMQRALRLLKTYFVGLLVIDEIQAANFAIASAAGIRDWILRIANIGTGLVLGGNPLAFAGPPPKKETDAQKRATQLMRRMFSADNIRIDPAPSHEDKDWRTFTGGIDRCRLVSAPMPERPELEALKFSLTGGFPDFYVELHASIEALCVKDESKPYDEKLINDAARQSSKLKEMKFLIDAFTARDSLTLRSCLDIDHQYYATLWGHESSAESKSDGPPSPAGIVAVEPSQADPLKTLAKSQAAAKKRVDRKQQKANKEMHPAAAAVLEHHLDGLNSVIAGKPDKKK